MSRKPDLKAGDVLSFRIPENISSDDLSHLKRIAKRPTSGKTGAINSFFFSKITEDRMQQSRHVSIDLPEVSDEQIAMVDSPIFKKALTMYAYQLLGATGPTVERMREALNNHEEHATKNETMIGLDQAQNQYEKQSDVANQPDQRALDLMRKLQG
ncbi:hypothetical protein [Sulfoacidibacillus ferrooxidans]|uniref:Uncharacterized protein n=1 Tax=Sulfoacidibacillus ferrooxidans TaxID=2005001 RepID=A0A9X1VAN5_9BACL|nr:hypothetical protein [Sulfoacidibacillus ferrooxidans]MCI0184746.1 hypothetical protein [Sulfoacidibacillus ferrooxidans]